MNHGALDNVVDRYEAAWNSLDMIAMAELWHAAEPDVYYVAEEIDAPLYDFDAVKAYWKMTRTAMDWVRLTTTERRYKLLTDDLAVATFAMHLDGQLKGQAPLQPQPFGVDVRVSALLRRVGDDWRFIHYAEAPLGALPFVRRAYRANVRD